MNASGEMCVNGALQQRTASASRLDETARVSVVLIHVGGAQGSTPVERERPCVPTVEQVKVDGAVASLSCLLLNLVSVRIPQEDAPPEYGQWEA